jgi:flagellar biosynthesis protein FlhG
MNRHTQVIGIASGKGGVGKTTVSVNLAVALAKQGKEVMLFDADLGLANAQLVLGYNTAFNFSHVLSGQRQLKEIIIEGPLGIKLVPGASGLQHMSALSEMQTGGIIAAFSELQDDVDYLIVDLGAGLSDMVMTFLQACQQRLIVLNNEPASIADAYGIIKVMIAEYQLDNISLIPNCVKSASEGQRLHHNINSVIGKFLESSVACLPSIREDQMVLKSIQATQPVATMAPTSPASRDFQELAKSVIKRERGQQPSDRLQFFFDRIISGPSIPVGQLP